MNKDVHGSGLVLMQTMPCGYKELLFRASLLKNWFGQRPNHFEPSH